MATQASYYQGISHVVELSTNTGTRCEHCSTGVGLDKFTESINHYIGQHGYKLLHVGTETSHDDGGKPWHSTIAILGK